MDPFEIPLFQQVYDFYRSLYICLQQFPRRDRYTLGQRCELLTIEVLQCIAQAGRLAKSEKAAPLEQASAALDLLRVTLRLAKDVRALKAEQYINLQTTLDGFGRMLGGWRRSVLV